MGRYLRHTMIAALLLLAVMSFGCSREPSPQEIVSKAANVAAGVSSYRSNTIMTQISDGETTKWIVQSKYSAPGRYWDKASNNHGRWFETLVIGDKCYFRNWEEPEWHTPQFWSVWSALSLKEQLDSISSLTDLERLPDEAIDGVDCFHFGWEIDSASNIEKLKPHVPEPLLQEIGQISSRCELWIAKDSYLVRQLKMETQSPEFESVAVTRFYDFNKEIQIKAPEPVDIR